MDEIAVLQVLGRSAGGIATHVNQIVDGLASQFRLEVAGPRELAHRLSRPPIEVDIPNGLVGHRRAVIQLRGLLGSRDYAVVHAHGLRAGIDAAVACQRTGHPLIVTLHNVIRPETAGIMAPLYRRVERRAVCGSMKTVAVSQEMASYLRRVATGCAERIEVLHVAVGDPPPVTRSRAEIRSELQVDEADRVVVSVTRLAPQKDIPTLFRAIAQLDDATLALVGEGPLRSELERLALDLGIAGRVRFLGWQAHPGDYVAAADVFCLSSIWEAVALAAQEAVLLGVPVVATGVGGLPELIVDGVSGRLVPAGDPDALASALRSILDSPSTGGAYAAAAKEYLSANFSREQMLNRLSELYREAARAH